jgi:hypothetical protein
LTECQSDADVLEGVADSFLSGCASESREVIATIHKSAGNPLARRLHKRCATAYETAFAELLHRARGNRKFLETKEPGSRLTVGYRALEESREGDIQNQDDTVTTGFRTDQGGRKKWLETFTQDKYKAKSRQRQ